LGEADVQRLHKLDWIDSRTIAVEYRWAEGRYERTAEIAAEFVRLKVDVILTHNTPPVLAAKQATSISPIVFATAADPVGTGVVASLAQPGGNVTGLSSQTTDLAGKRIELLREVVPGLRRLAILANPDNSYVASEVREIQAAARTLALEVDLFEVRQAQDIARVFEGIKDPRRRLISCPIRSGDCRRGDLGYPGPAGGTLRGRLTPRFRTIAPFGDFARPVKHMRFPTQTRESPHFRAWTRAIVKPFLVGAHGLLELHATGSRA